ncbi:hypothetical protein GQ53DRAFT_153881 [Thozetella sp. PMI_491]|nr:hypothetical protein GQ53DRAFT_153881 [Thozetella sp. PMI_491]
MGACRGQPLTALAAVAAPGGSAPAGGRKQKTMPNRAQFVYPGTFPHPLGCAGDWLAAARSRSEGGSRAGSRIGASVPAHACCLGLALVGQEVSSLWMDALDLAVSFLVLCVATPTGSGYWQRHGPGETQTSRHCVAWTWQNSSMHWGARYFRNQQEASGGWLAALLGCCCCCCYSTTPGTGTDHLENATISERGGVFGKCLFVLLCRAQGNKQSVRKPPRFPS